jgi:hypothetical protein
MVGRTCDTRDQNHSVEVTVVGIYIYMENI